MEAKHTASRIFKVLFILFLVISVLTSAVYLSVSMSVSKAKSDNGIPEMFGKQYVPMMKSGLFETIQPGSIVLIEETYANQVQPGVVILYETPADTDANEVFNGLSLATVQDVSQSEEGGATTFTIKDGTTDELRDIAAESIIGKGVYTLNGMGNALQFVNSTAGLIVLEVVPVSIFLISLILFLVLRPKRGYVDDEEEEILIDSKPQEAAGKMSKENPLFDTDIVSKTVSSASSRTIPEPDIDKPSAPVVSESLMDEFLREEAAAQPHVSETTAAMGITPEVKSQPEESEDDTMDQLLRDLETPAENKNSDHTMEFDLAKLQEQILNDTSNEQSNGILNDLDKQIAELKEPEDSIQFMLHENSIDVNFRNIISMDIEIENHPDGSGFTVKTPNYNAAINIHISKNK
ncbi:S24/S26 family peptidase [Massiliimalia massiliensis]|jgi:hypothetical protein|uniref:hypothetical protein n=1 Tax=Massiliimalia massiliensis TaxID=1852384 RepID=UPI000986B557|nr:hypothetical protein [Massiliimalia massiliensis]